MIVVEAIDTYNANRSITRMRIGPFDNPHQKVAPRSRIPRSASHFSFIQSPGNHHIISSSSSSSSSIMVITPTITMTITSTSTSTSITIITILTICITITTIIIVIIATIIMINVLRAPLVLQGSGRSQDATHQLRVLIYASRSS